MNQILEKIAISKHIVVVSRIDPDADSLGGASAMYTFLLQNHKKVSWFCKTKSINQKFVCIPWFEKIKDTFPISADLIIALGCSDKKNLGIETKCELINIDHCITNGLYGEINLVDQDAISTTKVLFDYFKNCDFKINKKMATALYAGLLERSESFVSTKVDGTTFALVQELIALGADFKICNENIAKRVSLAALRLKATMFKNMSLECGAKVALFCVSNKDIISSGATYEDCIDPLRESLGLGYVEIALLLMQNSDFTIKVTLISKNGTNADFEFSDRTSLEEAKKRVLISIKKDL